MYVCMYVCMYRMYVPVCMCMYGASVYVEGVRADADETVLKAIRGWHISLVLLVLYQQRMLRKPAPSARLSAGAGK